MNLLLAASFEAAERERWVQALRAALPAHRLALEVDSATRLSIDVAVVANPPPGALQGLPSLRLIQSLWAGVDRLLADASLPPDVPIVRMIDPTMSSAMAETALWAVLALHRGFFAYQRRQREGRWIQHAQRRADECQVLVLGAGAMGRTAAERLAQQGFRVSAWRSGAGHGNVANPSGTRIVEGRAALWSTLGQAQIVVNLLPLTADTHGLLDARFFAALPRAAGIANFGRGGHLVDADLLAALDSGHLRHAVLDVFVTEPLPTTHPFWTHPSVTLLPHVAALTDERSAAQVVARNLAALDTGQALSGLVDRARGY